MSRPRILREFLLVELVLWLIVLALLLLATSGQYLMLS
jgi:hypothetical protein